jgi:hypothetical protein
MPAVATQRGLTAELTAEEFWQQYAGKPYELVRGEVKERMPVGLWHGILAGELIARFRDYSSMPNAGQLALKRAFGCPAWGESVALPIGVIRQRLPPLPNFATRA